MKSSRPPAGRDERGSAVVAVLILLSATLLVVVGARLFGGAAALQFRCEGDAVRAIGSGSAPGCGSAGHPTVARFASSPAGAATPVRPPPAEEAGLGLEDRQRLEVQRSREGLAPLFQIVASGVERAAQNQVTADEFDELVRLYNDVRQMHTSIQPAEESAPYWDSMMADLALILQTAGGRELVRRLARHSRGTRLAPAYRLDQAGEPDPALGLDTSNGETRITERGAYVAYAPGEWLRLPDSVLARDPWAVSRSDVVLYHELVHVLDFHDQTALPGSDFDDNLDYVPLVELRAVGLGRFEDEPISENAYRAARREIGARGTGAALGDAGMPHRPRYFTRIPAAEPPGPQPAPPAGDR